MDVPANFSSIFWNFLVFLPFFLGLFMLGSIKGLLVLPFSISVLSIGNTAVLLGLWPVHVIGMYYTVARTKWLGPVLRVVLLLILPLPLVSVLVFGIVGSVLAGIGYGFFTPLVATFEAIRKGRERKFAHCFVDGIWYTIKGSCTVVRDFTDFCFHSYFAYLKDFIKDPSSDFQPYEIKVNDLPGCVAVGIFGVLIDVPLITFLALGKSPFMLFKGWRKLLQDLIGREGPFLETVCVPVAGLAVLLWPLIVVIYVISAILSSIFIGSYAAVIVYQESSIQNGLAYIVAAVAEFDEYTNDLLYLQEGSWLPRPQYRSKADITSETYSSDSTRWPRPREDVAETISTLKSISFVPSHSGSDLSSSALSFTYSRSLRQTLQEVKMVQVLDNMFKSQEIYGKRLIDEGAINLRDLEEWTRSNNSAKSKIIGIGLPAYSIIKTLIRSGKAGVSGLLLLDGVELTVDNRPRDHICEWFFEPLLVLKMQIQVAHLKGDEELYLLKYVLGSGDLDQLSEWRVSVSEPVDEVRKGQLLAWSRRVQGIATSLSRLPTFRRRYQAVIKTLISHIHINMVPTTVVNRARSFHESSLSESRIDSTKAQNTQHDDAGLHRPVSLEDTVGDLLKGYTSVDYSDRV